MSINSHTNVSKITFHLCIYVQGLESKYGRNYSMGTALVEN